MRIRRPPTEDEVFSRALEIAQARLDDKEPTEQDLREARAQLEADEAEAESMDIAPPKTSDDGEN